MQLTINIEDKKLYDSLVQFLKTLGISIISLASEKNVVHKRPLGLCKGEFIVPDNFNEELPQNIISLFHKG